MTRFPTVPATQAIDRQRETDEARIHDRIRPDTTKEFVQFRTRQTGRGDGARSIRLQAKRFRNETVAEAEAKAGPRFCAHATPRPEQGLTQSLGIPICCNEFQRLGDGE
ncbi:hypothetical protein ABWH91_02055 [Phycisphaerales bacterium ac7]